MPLSFLYREPCHTRAARDRAGVLTRSAAADVRIRARRFARHASRMANGSTRRVPDSRRYVNRPARETPLELPINDRRSDQSPKS